MTPTEHKTQMRVALIGAAGLAIAAIIGGLMAWAPEVLRDLFNPTPRQEPRKLTVQLPNQGKLPHSNVDVAIPDARPEAGQAVWLAIRHVKDDTWYLYPCTADPLGRASCVNVTVGANVDSLGPWDIAGIVVDDGGREKIIEGKSKHEGNLVEWFDKSLLALGSSSASR